MSISSHKCWTINTGRKTVETYNICSASHQFPLSWLVSKFWESFTNNLRKVTIAL